MSRRLALVALTAACATPTTVAAPALEEGAGAATSSPTVIHTARARAVPSVASRSRTDRRSLAWTGSHTLDVTCYAYTGNRTASGKWPRVGMAASNTYPFGTRLLVESVGVVQVEDRIGSGSDLDLYGPSEAFCRRFGRKQLRVQVAS